MKTILIDPMKREVMEVDAPVDQQRHIPLKFLHQILECERIDTVKIDNNNHWLVVDDDGFSKVKNCFKLNSYPQPLPNKALVIRDNGYCYLPVELNVDEFKLRIGWFDTETSLEIARQLSQQFEIRSFDSSIEEFMNTVFGKCDD